MWKGWRLTFQRYTKVPIYKADFVISEIYLKKGKLRESEGRKVNDLKG